MPQMLLPLGSNSLVQGSEVRLDALARLYSRRPADSARVPSGPLLC